LCPHVIQLRGNRRNKLLADEMLEATAQEAPQEQPPEPEPSE